MSAPATVRAGSAVSAPATVRVGSVVRAPVRRLRAAAVLVLLVASAPALAQGRGALVERGPAALPAPSPAFAVLLEAERSYQSGDLLIAQVEFERAVTLEPNLMPAWFRLGVIHQRLGQTAEAFAAYDRVIELGDGASDATAGELAAKARYNRALLHLALAGADLRAVRGQALAPEQRRAAELLARDLRDVSSRLPSAQEAADDAPAVPFVSGPVATDTPAGAAARGAPATAAPRVTIERRATAGGAVEVIQGGMNGGRQR